MVIIYLFIVPDFEKIPVQYKEAKMEIHIRKETCAALKIKGLLADSPIFDKNQENRSVSETVTRQLIVLNH